VRDDDFSRLESEFELPTVGVMVGVIDIGREIEEEIISGRAIELSLERDFDAFLFCFGIVPVADFDTILPRFSSNVFSMFCSVEVVCGAF
jgi:hypothetical protein